MCPKRSFGTGMSMVLVITALACLISCGDIDQEQTEESLRFIEFVLFPTAPYVDKSYIEKVPEEEVAAPRQLDFEAEKQAIQQVYSAFIKAYVAEDMPALRETLDTSTGIEWGTDTTGNVYEWHNIRTYIQTNWDQSDCQGESDWELIDFYIRPANVSAPWVEASAKGPMFYYDPGSHNCYNALGRFYLIKKSDEWRIHQIDGSKYFVDEKYRVP